MASFICVMSVEAMTHAAVLRKPELLDNPRFVEEVAALVTRYLTCGEPIAYAGPR